MTAADWSGEGSAPLLAGLAALTLLAAILFAAADLTDEEAGSLKTGRLSGPWVLAVALAVALLWPRMTPHSVANGNSSRPPSAEGRSGLRHGDGLGGDRL